MKELEILSGKPYKVYIDNDLDKLSKVLEEHKIKHKARFYLLTDDKVYELYKDKIEKFKDIFKVEIYYFNNGEKSKNYNTVKDIYSFLIEKNANRNSILIALGGGVVGDLGGFVASTYMRGIKYINIPTTLLSQVDSCIGGKVGYNFNGVKNIIGNFYNPEFVYISTNFLKTLDKKQFVDGLGEVIKYSLIKEGTMISYLRENSKGILERENDKMLYLVKNCLKIKKDIIEEDYKDLGIRNILNFGHTVGHGLEITSNGDLSHGEAVALGSLVALKLSEDILALDKGIYKEVEEVLNKLNLPTKHKVDNYKLFMYSINHDKKNDEDLNFVLLNKIGDPKIRTKVSKEQLYSALNNSINKGE
ncbi:3-dehydroquinate synthase [Clostridium sp. MSJ-11]|uniref:3-dehydroquinate synthase n=1 Tax=Clostridium mobile TaxID=2841512 RepID=A0ABS6ECS0_9CLOT|nr:3-dehydroquinate synthase [Clostridium mobile]MBU5482974.1 3-dehydroquinate synthase [Clostridium mobile]